MRERKLSFDPLAKGFMRNKALIFVMFLLAFTSLVWAQSFPDPRKPDEHIKWLADSLREMETIKAGNTRSDLLKVFTTEGGLSTGISRRYVYRKCPFIKVDVEFEPVGRPARDTDGKVTLDEDSRDVIKAISKPYLQWMIVD
jgi:hypothetical protein